MMEQNALLAISGRLPSSEASKAPEPRDEKIWKVAQDFESLLVNQLVQTMFNSVESDDALGQGGHAEKTFKSLLGEEYASNMTAAGGIGLADSVYREIIKLQEANQS